MKKIRWGSNGKEDHDAMEDRKSTGQVRMRLNVKTKSTIKDSLKERRCDESRNRVKRALSCEIFNGTDGGRFTEEAKTDKTEGQCEAQATPLLLEAPRGVSKGESPLCSPLLVGVANLGTPPPVSRHTQVPPGSIKRRRLSTKQRIHKPCENSHTSMQINQGRDDSHSTRSHNARHSQSGESHERRPVLSVVGRLRPLCTGET